MEPLRIGRPKFIIYSKLVVELGCLGQRHKLFGNVMHRSTLGNVMHRSTLMNLCRIASGVELEIFGLAPTFEFNYFDRPCLIYRKLAKRYRKLHLTWGVSLLFC